MIKNREENARLMRLFDMLSFITDDIMYVRENYESEILSYSLFDTLDALNDYYKIQKDNANYRVSDWENYGSEVFLDCMALMSGIRPANTNTFLQQTITGGFIKNANRKLLESIELDYGYWVKGYKKDPVRALEKAEHYISCLEDAKKDYQQFIEANGWSAEPKILLACQNASDQISDLDRKVREFRTFIDDMRFSSSKHPPRR